MMIGTSMKETTPMKTTTVSPREDVQKQQVVRTVSTTPSLVSLLLTLPRRVSDDEVIVLH